MRHHSVAPLPGEKRIKFKPGPRQVNGGQADRVEGRVPAPLMRVEGGRGLGDEAGAVAAQYIGRLGYSRPPDPGPAKLSTSTAAISLAPMRRMHAATTGDTRPLARLAQYRFRSRHRRPGCERRTCRCPIPQPT